MNWWKEWMWIVLWMKYLFALISISMNSVSMIADGFSNLNSLVWFQFEIIHTHKKVCKVSQWKRLCISLYPHKHYFPRLGPNAIIPYSYSSTFYWTYGLLRRSTASQEQCTHQTQVNFPYSRNVHCLLFIAKKGICLFPQPLPFFTIFALDLFVKIGKSITIQKNKSAKI